MWRAWRVAAVALICSSVLAGAPAAAADRRALLERALPWQLPDGVTPPYARFAGDLAALLAAQRREGVPWVTMFSVTRLERGSGEYLLLLNTITSLVLIGGADSYIVVASSPAALDSCLHLRLPCYNATAAVHERHLTDYNLGTWVKVFMARLVLAALPPGLSLHVSDHDVVYLKRVYPSADRFFSHATADYAEIAFAVEDFGWTEAGRFGSYIVNTGVIFARNTRNVRRLYDRWAAAATPDAHDQLVFARLLGSAWVSCSTPHTCHVARDTARVAAVARHNTPWRGNEICARCAVEEKLEGCYHQDEPNHCAVPYRLYIHFICLDKMRLARALGLWLLSEANPMVTNASAIAAAGLPCAEPNDSVASMVLYP